MAHGSPNMTKRQMLFTATAAAVLVAAALVYFGAAFIESVKAAHGG